MQYQYSDRIKDIRPSAIREILKYAATHPGVIALSTGSPADEAVYQFLDKKRAEGKPYYVYMTAGANKFLRIYYGRVKEYLATLPES